MESSAGHRTGSENGRPRVAIHCQYVYGIGHYVRSLQLARGLSKGFDVFLLNGGEVVPNYNLPPCVSCLQLPEIRKEETSPCLLPVDRSWTLDDCFRARANVLEDFVNENPPDILITEHYPFGDLFETEVMRLIADVKKRKRDARIVSSVRDVVESETGSCRDRHVCSVLNQIYDMVLVHSDERMVPFSTSFPLVHRIEIPVHHTGYIVQPVESRAVRDDPPLLLVSIGGGTVGGELLDAVLDAHERVAKEWRHQMVLFAGAFQKDIRHLRRRSEEVGNGQVTIRAFDRDGYRDMLASASGVICLGGYNSILEAVSAGLPTLVYERTFHGSNREQAVRTALFERSGLIRRLSPKDLSIDRIVPRILALLECPRSPHNSVRMDGAENSRLLLNRLMYSNDYS